MVPRLACHSPCAGGGTVSLELSVRLDWGATPPPPWVTERPSLLVSGEQPSSPTEAFPTWGGAGKWQRVSLEEAGSTYTLQVRHAWIWGTCGRTHRRRLGGRGGDGGVGHGDPAEA